MAETEAAAAVATVPATEVPSMATTITTTKTTARPSSTRSTENSNPGPQEKEKETEKTMEVTTPAAAAVAILLASGSGEPESESANLEKEKDALFRSNADACGADANLNSDVGVMTSTTTLITTTTTTQPIPTQDPELGLKGLGVGNRAPGYDAEAQTYAPASVPVVRRRRRHGLRKLRSVLSMIGSVLLKTLSLLWIGLLYGIPGAIIVALGIAVFVGIPLAFGAAYGSVGMLIGNGILRAARMAHYTNNASAAAIGATGAAISGPCLGFVLNLCGVRYDEENPSPWYIRMPTTVVAHTMSGAIGYAVLAKHHVDLGPIDVLHATRAGALGGAVLGPGTLLLMPVVAVVLGIVFSPLWIAMMMGLRWCYARSSETLEGGWYTHSYCISYGTCGDDEEIEEEIAMAQSRKIAWH